MSDNSAIEWTDASWNPVTGCTKVSPGCDHCYAETFAERWRGKPGHYFQNGFDITLRPDKLDLPLRWRKPRRIFVNSMSDLFHDKIPDEYIARVFAVMAVAHRHTFQVLTKRHGRMRSLLSNHDRWNILLSQALNSLPGSVDAPMPPADFDRADMWLRSREYRTDPLPPLANVWLGVSVENQHWANIRIPALLDTPAAVRWISAEPLLGPVDLRDCGGIDAIERDWIGSSAGGMGAPHPLLGWVVCGGESGAGARPMHPDWARSLRDQCQTAGVPFLFKQRGEWTWTPQDTVARNFVGPLGEWSRTLPRTGRPDRWWPMWRVGKHRAGRELDGATWDEYPAVTS